MRHPEFDRVPDGSRVKGMLVMAGKASIPAEKVKPLGETAAAEPAYAVGHGNLAQAEASV